MFFKSTRCINSKKPIKVVLVFCEGKTDVSFLRVILLLNQYKDYKEVVSEIKFPLNSLFLQRIKNYDYDSSELLDRPMLPLIMRRSHGQQDSFLFLYSMDGLGRISDTKKIIGEYTKFISTNEDMESYLLPPKRFSIALITDLDDFSIPQRLDFIKENFSDILPDINKLTPSNLVQPPIIQTKNYES